MIRFFTDGGSRGNPGAAAAGVVIIANKKRIKIKKYLGKKTNNQAEYLALILALKKLKSLTKKYKSDKIKGYLDSELVVKQLKGEYKIKNKNIKPLYKKIQALLKNLPIIYFSHIKREKNQLADGLVNEALDKKL